MIDTATKTDRFRELIEREVKAAKEDELMEKWELYEHLKGFIPAWDINYLTAIKIITEAAEV